jgi:hypothetical protein
MALRDWGRSSPRKTVVHSRRIRCNETLKRRSESRRVFQKNIAHIRGGMYKCAPRVGCPGGGGPGGPRELNHALGFTERRYEMAERRYDPSNGRLRAYRDTFPEPWESVPVPVRSRKTPKPVEAGGVFSVIKALIPQGFYWRRRADSNRCMEVLQTSPLATWVRRLQSRTACAGNSSVYHAITAASIMVFPGGAGAVNPTRAASGLR